MIAERDSRDSDVCLIYVISASYLEMLLALVT